MGEGIRVGVTLGRGSEDLVRLLWSSGIYQNAAFLLLLLKRLPKVGMVAAVNCDGDAEHPLARWAGVPTLPVAEVAGRIDILIELGARASPDLMQRFRSGGGRLVSYMAGNALALNFEAVSSELDHGEILSEVGFDAAWITPQHWHMNEGYCRMTRSERVERVPHIWDPMLFESQARASSLNPFYKPNGHAGWRIGILEPNVNVLKTFHLPLLVCEEGYRASPALFGRVLIFNSAHLIGVPHFDELTSQLELSRAKRLFAEQRMATPEILGRFIDAVVVHQWQNELNYLYCEILWSGHPLVHNSPALGEAGYRYESFNPADGGRVLADALERHPSEAPKRRRQALELLHQSSIDNPAVLERHAALLEELMP